MNVTPENIIVNSCEYTPVYLISNSGVTEADSYIITQSNQDGQKPVTVNLKSFYENSGNLENSLLNSPKRRLIKNQNSNSIGNNLKLASFLVPKNETIEMSISQHQYVTPMNNVIPSPTVTTLSTNVVNKVPRVEVDRKIVPLKTIQNKSRNYHGRVLPKIKPKNIIQPISSKHTSVQLLKLGETYHSLNQLNNDQMKIVNKALKIFSDPEKTPAPAYDPVTNTKFIYKVVSPKDLTVVGKNKALFKHKKNEIKRHGIKKVEKKEVKQISPADCDGIPDEPDKPPAEPTVTRSGRTVKLPKQIVPEDSPQRPRKKIGSVVSCTQCSVEFGSLYRLQRHFENNPTHIPARIHSNLFHCLLAIIKGGSAEDQANMFIQQLEQLIDKLRSLLPCLLKKIDGCEGKLCSINDDIGRLFGMNPGKYNLNVDALNCVKENDGHCIHNPAPKNNQFTSDLSKPSQLWLSKHNEEIANNEAEIEDCARINSVDKWPTVSKRIWKLKQQKSQKSNAKRMRLVSESGEQLIELGMEDVVTFSKPSDESAINLTQNKSISLLENDNEKNDTIQHEMVEKSHTNSVEDQSKKTKSSYAQFRSTHFDIRSSPIKLPSALVCKFQINPDKISNYEVQVMQPLTLAKTNESSQETVMRSNSDTLQLQGIFRDNIEMSKDTAMNNELHFDTPKDWTMTTSHNDEPSHVLFESTLANDKDAIESTSIRSKSKSSSLIESNLMDIQDNCSNIFEPSPIQIKNRASSLTEPSILHVEDKSSAVFYSALSHVKERSKTLFQSTLSQQTKDINMFESPLDMKDKSINLFETNLSHVKGRSNNMFEQSLIPGKERCDSVIEQSLMHVKDKSLFENALQQRTDNDNMIEPAMMHEKDKDQSDHLNINENSLLSNQGQSVLNFLESLGSDCLAYPETEIRNNSVDFQLDLFSFNTA